MCRMSHPLRISGGGDFGFWRMQGKKIYHHRGPAVNADYRDKDAGTAKRLKEHVGTGHRETDSRKSFAPANQSAGFI